MEIKELDLETRNKIYSHTKSILRKYQKGIVTGKLTADKFAKSILCDDYFIIENFQIILSFSFFSDFFIFFQPLILAHEISKILSLTQNLI